jgi:hypothetical protein
VIFGDDEPGAIDLLGEDQGEDMDFQPVGPDPWDVPEQRPTLRNPVTRFEGEFYRSFGPAPIIGEDEPSAETSPAPTPAPAPPHAAGFFDLTSIEHAMSGAVRTALAHELVSDAALLLFAGEDEGSGDYMRDDAKGLRG